MGSIEAEKPHAVCIPFPAQGHVNPMLQLAKLLHSNGFHITFVNTEYNHRRLLRSRGPDALRGLPDFRFDTIPDGLPPSDKDATQDPPSLCDSTSKNCLAPFCDLLAKLGHPSSGVPPVSCIILDGVMSFAIDAAKKMGIPDVVFWTTSACGFMAYLHYQHLINRALIPLKNEEDTSNRYLDMPIDWVPGMKNMRLRDFPSFIRTTNPEDIMLNFLNREAQRAMMGSMIIMNTFDGLEREVLEAMRSMLPPVYTVGPLSFFVQQLPASPVKSLGSNLWREERDCFQWLEGKKPSSVVLVNFGSVTVMTNEHLVEFAWGLANSQYDFLWVIRSDLVNGDTAVLPPEFIAETKERRLLTSWCPQEEVLSHPSIGGFLTHSGWNSTIESLSHGVPMVSWPFFAEQQTNCRYACTEWGVGMEIDGDVKREEVEKMVRELMGGEKGRQMRRRAMEWKEAAIEATKPGGSSFLNLNKFVKEVLLCK